MKRIESFIDKYQPFVYLFYCILAGFIINYLFVPKTKPKDNFDWIEVKNAEIIKIDNKIYIKYYRL